MHAMPCFDPRVTATTKKLVVTTSGSSIILAADKTVGTLVAPFNTAVAYGWSYIQVGTHTYPGHSHAT